MHLRRYQLNCEPFFKATATKDAFQSRDYTQCMQRLDYLAKNRGLALICAAPGYGKSFCLRSFAEQQNPNLVKVVYICMTTLTAMEFYRQLAQALGLEAFYRKADLYRSIQENLEYFSVQKKIHVIIVIDEAQYLPMSVLRDLKLLMNFDYDSRDRFSLVLSGQPVLADMLSRQIHEALRQRITVNYTFSGLLEAEAKSYAEKMIEVAGGGGRLFEDAALHAAYNCANGAIRVFGHVLGGALMAGGQAGADVINAEMVMAAANEMEIR